MKFKNSIKLSLAAALLSLGACTGDFYEKNTNPDEATDEMLGWDDLRTGSAFMQLAQNVIPTFQIVGGEEYGSANFQVIQDLAGNIFAGYTGATKSSFRANNLYDILAAEWHNAMHDDAFQRAMGPWAQLDALREESPEAVALADVLKVAVMHRVTDTYGPIAYLSIGSSGIQQEYDSQEVIYNRFFEELDAAITLLTDFYEKNPSATLLANYDPIYKGNVRAWVKFANTLRLRLAMRVYYADRELSKAQAEAAINNSVGLMTDASDIAQFAKPATATQWEYPLYMIQYSFNGGDSRIGATIESYMNGYEDPRREAYFTKNSRGEYRGVRNGINITGRLRAVGSALERQLHEQRRHRLDETGRGLVPACRVRAALRFEDGRRRVLQQGYRVLVLDREGQRRRNLHDRQRKDSGRLYRHGCLVELGFGAGQDYHRLGGFGR